MECLQFSTKGVLYFSIIRYVDKIHIMYGVFVKRGYHTFEVLLFFDGKN